MVLLALFRPKASLWSKSKLFHPIKQGIKLPVVGPVRYLVDLIVEFALQICKNVLKAINN